MIWLLSGFVVLAALVGLIFISYKLGRISVQKEIALSKAGVKDEQIKVAVNRPAKSGIVDSLRDGKF